MEELEDKYYFRTSKEIKAPMSRRNKRILELMEVRPTNIEEVCKCLDLTPRTAYVELEFLRREGYLR